MIDAAKSTLSGAKDSNIEYRVGNAEDLGWLGDQSVDLVTAGKFYALMSRV